MTHEVTQRARGTGSISQYGYVRLQAGKVKKVEHLRIAEAVLGRPLPIGAVVHHVNGDKSDNRKTNLVICQDQRYHLLLHTRMASIEATGNPDARKCWICRTYDEQKNLVTHRRAHYHRECDREYQRIRRAKRSSK